MAAPDDRANLGTLLGLVLFAAICGITLFRYHPPAAKPVDAPPSQFSAGRARSVLYGLVADAIPHPIGSAENGAVREKIVQILTDLGYQPQIQPGFGCNEWGSCGSVLNVVARVEGTEPGEAVLLAAHYDSVPAGPGASDDGLGVAAVLEIARILKTIAPPRHAVILLLTDGEEAGMLGADVFVRTHPWAREVKVAVNVDARGTSGPSLMFETGSANDWAMRFYEHAVPHPITNSIYYTVYKNLPNDTDFSVFKGFGYQGLNFANIGGVMRYHTPLDNFENVSTNTLQHDGDSALATVLAFANADLSNPRSGDAVYFDVFGRWIVLWSERASFPIAATIAFLLLIEIALLIRRNQLFISTVVWGMFGWFVMLGFTGAIGYALLVAYRVTGAVPPAGSEYGWIAYPIVAKIAYLALAVWSVVFVVRIFQKRASFWGYWAAGNVLSATAAIWTSRNYPGASFLFIVPVTIALIAALPAVLDSKNSLWLREIAVLVNAAAIFSVFVPSIWFLYDALGVGILPLAAMLLTVAVASLAPAFTIADDGMRGTLNGLAVTIAILAGLLGFVTPVYSVHSPQRVNFQYWLDADAHRGKWLAAANSQRLADWLAAAASFKRKPQLIFPWDYSPRFSADAPQIEMARPELAVLSSEATGTGVRYQVRIKSPRGAPDCSILFPPSSGVASVEFEGLAVPKPSSRVVTFLNEAMHGWKVYEVATLPSEGIEMSFTLPSASPVEAYLLDESYALPPDGMFLKKARPPDAVPSQDGDATVVSRRIEIRPAAPISPTVPTAAP
ncbi:MAG: M28 family peptidase [Candidatus Acidiferrales bacterium]